MKSNSNRTFIDFDQCLGYLSDFERVRNDGSDKVSKEKLCRFFSENVQTRERKESLFQFLRFEALGRSVQFFSRSN